VGRNAFAPSDLEPVRALKVVNNPPGGPQRWLSTTGYAISQAIFYYSNVW
jgi:hypothetical protein